MLEGNFEKEFGVGNVLTVLWKKPPNAEEKHSTK